LNLGTALNVRKTTEGQWVVYKCREGKFILLSRRFATRVQVEKEREKLTGTFTSKGGSLGVGIVVKE
jgi:hypothetical protein